MRVINSKRKFIARVFDKHIYIDTENGTGFYEVLEEMKAVMRRFASRSSLPFEDFYQDLCVNILEGILIYDPSRNTLLSTFLYKICYYKLVDTYRSINMPISDINEAICYESNQDQKVEVMQRIQSWDDKWKKIMFRLFVEGEQINNVARDENITPWGLTRAVRRKLLEARNFRKRK